MVETVATLETVYIIISNNNVTDIGLICSMHVSTDVSTDLTVDTKAWIFLRKDCVDRAGKRKRPRR